MKVLHLSSERTWRGGEQQIAYLIAELNKKGIENLVACRKNSAFNRYCKAHNIDHISLPFKGQWDWFSALELRNFSRYMQVDIIHMHSSHSHALAVLSALLGNRTPLILSRRVDFPVHKNILSSFKYNYPLIKKIICVSDAIRQIMQPSVKNAARLVTVYDGIDLKKFQGHPRRNFLKQQYKISEQTTIIANISAIAPHKDYFTFVDTAEILLKKRQDVCFFIIGDGPERDQINQYIRAKNLNGKIIMTGFLTNIPMLFPEIDIFLMTSKTEGLGTTLLDAFAAGVPVVATTAGGIPEIVTDNQSGLLAPVRNPDKLADNIEKLINNPALRTSIIQNAKERVIDFSKEKMADKTLDVYKNVLKKAVNRIT